MGYVVVCVCMIRMFYVEVATDVPGTSCVVMQLVYTRVGTTFVAVFCFCRFV